MFKGPQKTIQNSIHIQGKGLHSGIKGNLYLKPAEVNTGILFKRTDVDRDKNIIEGSYKNVSSPILCTKIKNSYGISVSTVEHLMAAFYGEGIDNILVEVDCPEIPIMDGSAFDFVEAIRSSGTEDQKYSRKFINTIKKVEVKDGPKFISIEPLANDLIIDFEIVYKNPLIRTRRHEFKLSNGDLTSIYNSRTFCLYEDIDKIISQGLAKGGSLENAIVVKDNKILNDNGHLLVDWGLGDHWRFEEYKVGWVKNEEQEYCYGEDNFLWSTVWHESFLNHSECQKFSEWIKKKKYDDLEKAINDEVPSILSPEKLSGLFKSVMIDMVSLWEESPQLYILLSCIK